MNFNIVLETFENKDIKEFAEECLKNAPMYWYEVAASSTGKYHPNYALGHGGLARHTIALVILLNHMFAVESFAKQFTSRERDLLRVAGIAHDMMKSGTQEDYEKNKYTRFDHPILAANMIREMKGLPEEEIEFIAHAIESHMGQWNTDKRRPDVILPKPNDKYQIILHLADYLASRKDIEIKFDNTETNIEETKHESVPDVNTWKFDFGKYSGKTIPEIYNENPGYIHWAKENMKKEPARTLLEQFDI